MRTVRGAGPPLPHRPQLLHEVLPARRHIQPLADARSNQRRGVARRADRARVIAPPKSVGAKGSQARRVLWIRELTQHRLNHSDHPVPGAEHLVLERTATGPPQVHRIESRAFRRTVVLGKGQL
eukprot:scaffold2006_cov141-Isochrysis_galbana.AAC.17